MKKTWFSAYFYPIIKDISYIKNISETNMLSLFVSLILIVYNLNTTLNTLPR